jgi:SpoVK/Ycf46/Vps4 family AAA+-type ATPase
VSEPADVFERSEKFPNPAAGERYHRLVGLDEVKARLLTEARLLLNPELLERWSTMHHGRVLPVVTALRERVPLFVFAGDVGTGKTVLAETFGHELARVEEISVTLMRLSLNARGTGRVGEMTSLIATAFRAVEERVAGQRGSKRPTTGVVLLIDEADALAQSREASQMHHEDRAGVNALIRGIDHVSAAGLPVITVMCTNRKSAIDPAVQRRAAQIFEFERPNEAQRAEILRRVRGHGSRASGARGPRPAHRPHRRAPLRLHVLGPYDAADPRRGDRCLPRSAPDSCPPRRARGRPSAHRSVLRSRP